MLHDEDVKIVETISHFMNGYTYQLTHSLHNSGKTILTIPSTFFNIYYNARLARLNFTWTCNQKSKLGKEFLKLIQILKTII